MTGVPGGRGLPAMRLPATARVNAWFPISDASRVSSESAAGAATACSGCGDAASCSRAIDMSHADPQDRPAKRIERSTRAGKGRPELRRESRLALRHEVELLGERFDDLGVELRA